MVSKKEKDQIIDNFEKWLNTFNESQSGKELCKLISEFISAKFTQIMPDNMKKDAENDSDDNANKPHIVMMGNPSMLDMLPPEMRDAILKGTVPNNDAIDEAKPEVPSKVLYDFNMVNCNVDLKELTKKLKKSKITKYGILLYGVSGSGKSQFAKYLAQELGMGFIKERASDIFGKFVGESEGNIKKAFKKAKDTKSVLVFDEADSFLFDRNMARQAHEVSHTNELFVNMEDHPYPFVMTTNLKDKLDKASIRRFLFKVKFDWMTKDNIKAGLKTYFGKEYKFTKEQYDQLKYISAGDFDIAKQKLDILENGEYTSDKIFEYLLAEQNEKEIEEGTASIVF